MGFMGFLKSWMPDPVDDMDDADFNEEYDYYAEEPEEVREEVPVRRMHTTRIYDRDNKVVNIHAEPSKVIVKRPRKFDENELKAIADHLLERRTVVLNFENTDKNISRRLLDFFDGVAYALNGKRTRIGSNIFMITPSNVDIEETDGFSNMENTGEMY